MECIFLVLFDKTPPPFLNREGDSGATSGYLTSMQQNPQLDLIFLAVFDSFPALSLITFALKQFPSRKPDI